jgi:hypothetical protein
MPALGRCKKTGNHGYVLCNWINQKFSTRYYRDTFFFIASMTLSVHWTRSNDEWCLFIYENGLIKNPLSDIIGILLVAAPDLASADGYILCNWINQKFSTRYYRATLKEFLIWFYSYSVELTKNSILNIIELLSSSLPDSFSVLTVGDDFISSLNKVQCSRPSKWWMMFI